MNLKKLRVVIFQEGEWLCAHSLEYDFATQAKTLDALRYAIERMIVGHIAISLANGLKPFKNERRAPKKYWTLFERSKIALPPAKLWSQVQEAWSEDSHA